MRAIHSTRFGQMLINELDQYVGTSLMIYGEFSPGEASVFSVLIDPGMTVIDVGANVGAHTLQFARLVGPTGIVHAYEPQRLVYQMLCANMALNQIDNVFCHQEAVGAEVAEVRLASPHQDTPCNFGGLSLDQLQHRGTEPVAVRPLTTPCHFLKVDVEGMEQQVLEGAETMILACRPILYVENDRVEKSEALIAMVESLGYDAFWHITPLFCKDNFNGCTENVFGGNFVSANMLCLPHGTTNIQHGLDRATGNFLQYIR